MRKTKKPGNNPPRNWGKALALYLTVMLAVGIGLLLIQNGAVSLTDTYEIKFSRPSNKVLYSTTLTTDANLEYDKQGQPVLQAQQLGSRYLFSVRSETNNRTAYVPMGTKILVKYPDDGGISDYTIRIRPRNGVLDTPNAPSASKGSRVRYHLPLQTKGLYEITGEGTVTISIIER